MMEQWDNVLLCSLFVGLRFKGGAKAKDPGGGAAQLWWVGLSAELGWGAMRCGVLPARQFALSQGPSLCLNTSPMAGMLSLVK